MVMSAKQKQDKHSVSRRVKMSICCLFPVLAACALFVKIGLGADISVLNGDASLTISTATAGMEPDAEIDESCQLQWTTLISDPTKKITAQTNVVSPNFTLKVQAVSVSAGDGTSAGQITLSTSGQDVVVSIPADIAPGDPGTCTLRYTASANASDGTGSDVHTIIYTILDQ
jgi:hypothetical protein